MDHNGDAGDELQLLLDGRLTAERLGAVERHLAECGRCRRELEALRRVKAAISAGLPDLPLPGEVAARISRALAQEQAAPHPHREPIPRRWRRIAVTGLGLVAAAALVLVLARGGSGGADVVAAAAGDFAAHRTTSLPLQIETADVAALERFFVDAGLAFASRVFDLGMMGYRLVGGRVHRFKGRPSALFAYQSSEGRRLLCEMYPGKISELPPGAARREHNDIEFRVYRRGDLTLVFWPEGSVVCVLVANGDPEEVVQLAYAKAVKV